MPIPGLLKAALPTIIGGIAGFLGGDDDVPIPQITPEEREIRRQFYEFAKEGIPTHIRNQMFQRLRETLHEKAEKERRRVGADFAGRRLRTTGLLMEREAGIAERLMEEIGKGRRDIDIEAALARPRFMQAFLGVPRPEREWQFRADKERARGREGLLGGFGGMIGDIFGREDVMGGVGRLWEGIAGRRRRPREDDIVRVGGGAGGAPPLEAYREPLFFP